MGEPAPVILGGRPYPVAEVVAALLRYVCDEAVTFVGRAPARVVLTHPAVWKRTRLEALVEAAGRAGITDPVLVAEPVAAAMAYAERTGERPTGPVAVYDLGGGTFDTAVLGPSNGGFVVLGKAGGDDRIGGERFDELVVAHLGAGLPHAVWDQLQASDEPGWRQANAELRQKARWAKEALSRAEQAEVVIGHPMGLSPLTITKTDFEGLIRGHLEETLDVVSATVEDADITPSDLHAIYLVGGASRIPLVEDLVRAAYPDIPLHRHGDPKMVVAEGVTAPRESAPLSPRLSPFPSES